MRLPFALILVVLAAGTAPACRHGTGGCNPPAIEPIAVAAVRANSCPQAVGLNGVTYDLWCGGVRHERLGSLLGKGGDVPERYVIRRIEGVPSTSAIAVMEFSRALDAECGAWRFAPNESLPSAQARSLLRQVTIPASAPPV